MRFSHLAGLSFLVPALFFMHAQIVLPHALGDHAVLQRERPIHIWGWAKPGAHLEARFHTQTVVTEVDPLGKWNLWLAPEAAGGPYTLAITGDGEAKVQDLLVGDVWFTSGQSNMEMPLKGFGNGTVIKDGDKEIAAATNPRLRLLLTVRKSSDYPLEDNDSVWTTCTPETAANFSAVAYFFGREIAAQEKVPVGLIDSTWGGTPADSWVSLDTLGTSPELLPAFAARAHFADPMADDARRTEADKAEDNAAKAAGKSIPSHMWHPPETSWLPAGLYNGMIAPYTPYSIKGFLWYQGETNSGHDRAAYYRTLFPALIRDWRAQFAQGALPFYFVQISSFNSPGEDWGTVRDAQRRTLQLQQTGMAVTLDIGTPDNVHPPDKQTVSARLALAARAMTYGEHVEYTSPLFRQATSELRPDGTTAMRVWFDHSAGLTTKGKPVGGFELAGEDRKYFPAEARLEGQTVVVSAAALKHPLYVRYGWQGVVNDYLYNAADLPASTFTSDDEPR